MCGLPKNRRSSIQYKWLNQSVSMQCLHMSKYIQFNLDLFESQNKLCLTSSQKFVDAIGG